MVPMWLFITEQGCLTKLYDVVGLGFSEVGSNWMLPDAASKGDEIFASRLFIDGHKYWLHRVASPR